MDDLIVPFFVAVFAALGGLLALDAFRLIRGR